MPRIVGYAEVRPMNVGNRVQQCICLGGARAVKRTLFSIITMRICIMVPLNKCKFTPFTQHTSYSISNKCTMKNLASLILQGERTRTLLVGRCTFIMAHQVFCKLVAALIDHRALQVSAHEIQLLVDFLQLTQLDLRGRQVAFAESDSCHCSPCHVKNLSVQHKWYLGYENILANRF